MNQQSVCNLALADLLQRDVAELERTKQPGGEVAIPQFEAAIRELRPKFPVGRVADSVTLKISRLHPEILAQLGRERIREAVIFELRGLETLPGRLLTAGRLENERRDP